MSEAPKPKPLEEHIKKAYRRQGWVFDELRDAGDAAQFSILHSKDIEYDGYFGGSGMSFIHVFPKGVAGIKYDVQQVHERGNKALMIDLLGQGEVCLRLGADEVIATTATEAPQHSKIQPLYGDAFRASVIEEMFTRIRTMKVSGHELSTVFFRPYGGLSLIGANVFVHVIAYAVLRRLYDELMLGGKIFLQVKAFEGGHMLSRIVHEYGLEDIYTQKNGMAYIQKKEGVVFPNLHHVVSRMPELKEALTVMAEYDELYEE